MEITLGAALLAGILSFLSPCVLPVVPAYLGQLGVVVSQSPGGQPVGATTSLATAAGPATATMPPPSRPSWGQAAGWRSLPAAFAFVLGFGSIFTLLGLFVYVAVGPIKDNLPLLRTLGGILLILLGLNLMGVLRPQRLMGTWRPLARFQGGGFGSRRPARKGVVGGFILGAVFAIGWSPCIGPTLGAILTMAALGSSPQVALLLVAYSIGLGVPFILIALAVDKAPAVTRPLVKHGHTIELLGGGLIVIMGVAILFDWLTVFSQAFSQFIPQV